MQDGGTLSIVHPALNLPDSEFGRSQDTTDGCLGNALSIEIGIEGIRRAVRVSQTHMPGWKGTMVADQNKQIVGGTFDGQVRVARLDSVVTSASFEAPPATGILDENRPHRLGQSHRVYE